MPKHHPIFAVITFMFCLLIWPSQSVKIMVARTRPIVREMLEGWG